MTFRDEIKKTWTVFKALEMRGKFKEFQDLWKPWWETSKCETWKSWWNEIISLQTIWHWNILVHIEIT